MLGTKNLTKAPQRSESAFSELVQCEPWSANRGIDSGNPSFAPLHRRDLRAYDEGIQPHHRMPGLAPGFRFVMGEFY